MFIFTAALAVSATYLALPAAPSAEAQNSCPSPGFEYVMAITANAYVDDLGGQGYHASGSPAGCGTDPAWTLVSSACLFSGPNACWSMGCLYRRPATQPATYVITHWGNIYAGNNSGQSCAHFGYGSSHGSNVSSPPLGYVLKNQACAIRDGRGVCESDLCLWEYRGTTATTDLVLTSTLAAIYSSAPQCGAPAGFTMSSGACNLSIGGPCNSWVCLSEKTAQCMVASSSSSSSAGVTPQCSDGADNDGDQRIDTLDPGCHSDGNPHNAGSYVPADNDESSPGNTQCNDNADNDGDGLVDFPQDPGCVNPMDNDEGSGAGSSSSVLSSSSSSSAPITQCSDGIDNDADQRIDAFDPGCHSDGNPHNGASYVPSDTDESNPGNTQCNDNFDNDGDGLVDFPQDPGCVNPMDNDEGSGAASSSSSPVVSSSSSSSSSSAAVPQCMNGVDDDGDGFTDYPFDTSCSSLTDPDETNPRSQCQDGADNDGDGLIDGQDPGCTSSQDNNETNGGGSSSSAATSSSSSANIPQCMNGIDDDGDGMLDYPFDFSCSSPSDTDETNPRSQCQDGIDNDGDGLVDAQDPGCLNAQGNNEARDADGSGTNNNNNNNGNNNSNGNTNNNGNSNANDNSNGNGNGNGNGNIFFGGTTVSNSNSFANNVSNNANTQNQNMFLGGQGFTFPSFTMPMAPSWTNSMMPPFINFGSPMQNSNNSATGFFSSQFPFINFPFMQ